MANKKALQGFSGVQLFPVTDNTASKYSVGLAIPLPNVQEMSKDTDTSETKIYADDTIYLNAKSWNGLNVTITVADMTLEQYELLGFGTYDKDKEELTWNPQGKNKEFALSYKQITVDGEYRMVKMYSFTVNEIKETGIKTKGSGGDINALQIIGTFTARKVDGSPGAIHDGKDTEWLDTIEAVEKE